MRMHLNTILCAAAITSPLLAQFPPLLPYPRTMDHLVADTFSDVLWRLADRDQDGLFHSPGEITLAYDSAVGAFAWSSPGSLCVTNDGRVLIADGGNDSIYALRDLNTDGDYHDAGEILTFFDALNAAGIVMQQAQGITVDALGRVLVAVSQPGTGNSDQILLLQDLNLDGDANDAGEASVFYNVPGASVGSAFSIPTRILVGPDLAVYWNDVGTGTNQRGIWRLFDGNGNGNCNDPGEAVRFWNPNNSAPQYWSLAIDQAGAFYVSDHVNDLVYRGMDGDGSSSIDPSEQTLFYQPASGTTWWDLTVQGDGSLYLFNSDGTDTITRLVDLDADGNALGGGEAVEVYRASSAAQMIDIRAAVVLRAPQLLLSPNSASVGTSTQLYVRTTHPGDAVLSFVSLALIPPVSLPPFGQFELDPSLLILFDVGSSDAAGDYLTTIPVPFDFSLIGTYGVQSVCGDPFRAYLSNGTSMTLTP